MLARTEVDNSHIHTSMQFFMLNCQTDFSSKSTTSAVALSLVFICHSHISTQILVKLCCYLLFDWPLNTSCRKVNGLKVKKS